LMMSNISVKMAATSVTLEIPPQSFPSSGKRPAISTATTATTAVSLLLLWTIHPTSMMITKMITQLYGIDIGINRNRGRGGGLEWHEYPSGHSSGLSRIVPDCPGWPSQFQSVSVSFSQFLPDYISGSPAMKWRMKRYCAEATPRHETGGVPSQASDWSRRWLPPTLTPPLPHPPLSIAVIDSIKLMKTLEAHVGATWAFDTRSVTLALIRFDTTLKDDTPPFQVPSQWH